VTAELKKRIVTAILGVGLVLLVLFALGRLGAAIVAAVISLGMIWEFATLTFALSDRFEKRWVLLGLSWLVSFCNFWIPSEPINNSERESQLRSLFGIIRIFLP
jgi:CDP-diglyceride synthetase